MAIANEPTTRYKVGKTTLGGECDPWALSLAHKQGQEVVWGVRGVQAKGVRVECTVTKAEHPYKSRDEGRRMLNSSRLTPSAQSFTTSRAYCPQSTLMPSLSTAMARSTSGSNWEEPTRTEKKVADYGFDHGSSKSSTFSSRKRWLCGKCIDDPLCSQNRNLFGYWVVP